MAAVPDDDLRTRATRHTAADRDNMIELKAVERQASRIRVARQIVDMLHVSAGGGDGMYSCEELREIEMRVRRLLGVE